MPHDKDQERKEIAQAISFMSNIGITIAACVAVGVFLGKYLDNLLGTSPNLLILFSLLGVGTAVREIGRKGKAK